MIGALSLRGGRGLHSFGLNSLGGKLQEILFRPKGKSSCSGRNQGKYLTNTYIQAHNVPSRSLASASTATSAAAYNKNVSIASETLMICLSNHLRRRRLHLLRIHL